MKPNILDEINYDATAGPANPPVEALKSARLVSESDTIVLEDVRGFNNSGIDGFHHLPSTPFSAGGKSLDEGMLNSPCSAPS